MSNQDDKNLGLYQKYAIERLDDPEGKHNDCRLFIMDPNHDPIARHALAVYAREARKGGFVALADDLEKILKEVSP